MIVDGRRTRPEGAARGVAAAVALPPPPRESVGVVTRASEDGSSRAALRGVRLGRPRGSTG